MPGGGGRLGLATASPFPVAYHLGVLELMSSRRFSGKSSARAVPHGRDSSDKAWMRLLSYGRRFSSEIARRIEQGGQHVLVVPDAPEPFGYTIGLHRDGLPE